MRPPRAEAAVALTWVDEPPPSRTGRSADKWSDELEALRARPGQWARIATELKASSAHGAAKSIRDGKAGSHPAGSFEAVARATAKGIADLYARFVGTPPVADTTDRTSSSRSSD